MAQIPRSLRDNFQDFNPIKPPNVPLEVGRSNIGEALGNVANQGFAFAGQKKRAQDNLIVSDLSQKIKDASATASLEAKTEFEQSGSRRYENLRADTVKRYDDKKRDVFENNEDFNSLGLESRNLLERLDLEVSGLLGRNTELFAAKKMAELGLLELDENLSGIIESLKSPNADVNALTADFDNLAALQQQAAKNGSPYENPVQSEARIATTRDRFNLQKHKAITGQFIAMAAGNSNREPGDTTVGDYENYIEYYEALKNNDVPLPENTSPIEAANKFMSDIATTINQARSAKAIETQGFVSDAMAQIIQRRDVLTPEQFIALGDQLERDIATLPGALPRDINAYRTLYNALKKSATAPSVPQTNTYYIMDADFDQIVEEHHNIGEAVPPEELHKIREDWVKALSTGKLHYSHFNKFSEEVKKLGDDNVKRIKSAKSAVVSSVLEEVYGVPGGKSSDMFSATFGGTAPKIPGADFYGELRIPIKRLVNQLYLDPKFRDGKSSPEDAHDKIMEIISKGQSKVDLPVFNIPKNHAEAYFDRKNLGQEPQTPIEKFYDIAITAKLKRAERAQKEINKIPDSGDEFGHGPKRKAALGRILQPDDYNILIEQKLANDAFNEQVAAEELEQSSAIKVDPETGARSVPVAPERQTPSEIKGDFPEDTRVRTPARDERDGVDAPASEDISSAPAGIRDSSADASEQADVEESFPLEFDKANADLDEIERDLASRKHQIVDSAVEKVEQAIKPLKSSKKKKFLKPNPEMVALAENADAILTQILNDTFKTQSAPPPGVGDFFKNAGKLPVDVYDSFVSLLNSLKGKPQDISKALKEFVGFGLKTKLKENEAQQLELMKKLAIQIEKEQGIGDEE